MLEAELEAETIGLWSLRALDPEVPEVKGCYRPVFSPSLALKVSVFRAWLKVKDHSAFSTLDFIYHIVPMATI